MSDAVLSDECRDCDAVRVCESPNRPQALQEA